MRQHRDGANSGARRARTSLAPGGAGFPSGRRPSSRTRLVRRWTRSVDNRARSASGRSPAVPSTSSLPVCLFVCLLIIYNDAFDRINVMASINVRQRISVHTMGTSRPSLTGQWPPIKRKPDPIPFPTDIPPKRQTKICETKKIPISHPKNRKKATGEPKRAKPGPTPHRPTKMTQRHKLNP